MIIYIMYMHVRVQLFAYVCEHIYMNAYMKERGNYYICYSLVHVSVRDCVHLYVWVIDS